MRKAPTPPALPDTRPRPVRILAPLIEEAIDRRNKAEHRPARSWHASSLGKGCGRQMFYGRKGYPPERWIKPQYSRDGDAGTVLHEVYQKYVEDTGFLHTSEEKIAANVWVIGGRMDGVVTGELPRFLKPGEKGLLEIKTMKAEQFSAMPDHDKYDGYYAQIQVYLALRPELARALLLLVCRDDSRMKEFVIERNRVYGDYLLAKAAYLEECYQRDEVPDAEPSWLCDYCEFRVRCDAHDAKEDAA